MAGISVVGMMEEAPGIKGAMAKFVKHNQDCADAVRNVSGIGTATGKPVHQDEIRPAFVGSDYPRMVYHADGRDKLCHTVGEYNSFVRSKGFRDTPFPRVQVAIADPKTEKLELQTALRQKDGEIASQQEMLQTQATLLEQQGAMLREMQERMLALESNTGGYYEPDGDDDDETVALPPAKKTATAKATK